MNPDRMCGPADGVRKTIGPLYIITLSIAQCSAAKGAGLPCTSRDEKGVVGEEEKQRAYCWTPATTSVRVCDDGASTVAGGRAV